MSARLAELLEALKQDLSTIQSMKTVLDSSSIPMTKDLAEAVYNAHDFLERIEITYMRQINDGNTELGKLNDKTNGEETSAHV